MASTMAELNCISYRIQFLFPAKNFDSKKFKKIAGLDPDDPVFVSVVANSKNKDREEHVHIDLDISKDKGRLLLGVFPKRVKFKAEDGTGKNTVENRLIELAETFKVKTLQGNYSA